MTTSGQNIYRVEYHTDGSVVFVDTEEIDDKHVLNALGGGAEAGGAQRLLAQRKNKYVFRKMSEKEFNSVRQQRGLHLLPEKGPLKETWITEDLEHSRQFQNKGVKTDVLETVAEFRVGRKQYNKAIKDHMIPQQGSKKTNLARVDKKEIPFNVPNRELLKECPARRVNVGLKGPENVRAFNETIITVKEVYPHAFMNKNAFTRWASKNKLGAGLAAVGLILDAASITMAVQDDKGCWGKHTTMALSSIAGGYAGGAAGAKIGAALGSVFPIVGTAIGAFIGALLGGILGSLAAEAFTGIWVSLRRVAPGPGPPPLMWDLETHGPPPLDTENEGQEPPELDQDQDKTATKGAPDLDFDLDGVNGAPSLGF